MLDGPFEDAAAADTDELIVPEPSAELLTVTVGEVPMAVAEPEPVSPENCVVVKVLAPDWEAEGAVAAPPAPVPYAIDSV